MTGVNSSEFSPNGNYIVTVSDDNTVKLWNAKTGKQVGETMTGVNSFEFSPDGSYLVTYSNYYEPFKVWNAKTGRQVGEIMEYNDRIVSAEFSYDERYIVIVSEDCTIKITEYPSLQELIDKYRKIYKYWPLTEGELEKYNFK